MRLYLQKLPYAPRDTVLCDGKEPYFRVSRELVHEILLHTLNTWIILHRLWCHSTIAKVFAEIPHSDGKMLLFASYLLERTFNKVEYVTLLIIIFCIMSLS